MPIHFTKFHGFGNDYLVIEEDELASVPNIGRFAQLICNRHYGAGSDGIAVVRRLAQPEADYRVRIFNPDGSEAELSGNGTRCAATYLYYKQLWTADELRLLTRAGVKRYLLVEQKGAGSYVFDSELGQPRFDNESIPMLTEQPLSLVAGYPLKVGDETVSVTALQMGNPNCCLFVENFEELDWRRLGAAIERHPQFPERTNVVFVRVLDRQTIELRIWERGVGETTASGTCSCAAAVAAMINEKADRDLNVLMPGGEAIIHWQADGEVVLRGSAEVIYGGNWLGPVT